MIVRFQKENLLLEAEDTLISVGGLGISPRQALTVFGIKESEQKKMKTKEELSNWIVLFSFTFAIIIQK